MAAIRVTAATPKSASIDISDNYESEDGTYQIAMVTDVGQLKDGSFNQFTWNGVKKYAYDNNKSYKYYQPANDANATDADRIKAMTDACDAGAEDHRNVRASCQETALKEVAPKYPDVQFVFIDGWDMGMKNLVGVVLSGRTGRLLCRLCNRYGRLHEVRLLRWRRR